MATELRLTRTLRGFEPSDDDSREAMKAIKLGASVKCEVRIARDNSRMRYFWGLVGVIVDNTDDEIFGGSKEACADSIKLAIGHVDQVQVYDEAKGWRIERSPKSISFSKLTEPEFQEPMPIGRPACSSNNFGAGPSSGNEPGRNFTT